MAEYIEREAAQKQLKNRCIKCDAKHEDRLCLQCDIREALEIVKETPSVNVVPIKYARWEWFDEDTGTPLTGYEREWGWRCSYCRYELSDDYDDPDYHPKFNYCPNCGAKMDGGSTNELV